MSFADQLTVARAISVPIVVALFAIPFPNHDLWATGVFCAAMATDWFDGRIARRTGRTSSFGSLPTVAFVTPNMCDDMHDCSIGTGNSWLQSHLDAYAQWAKANNSLLIVTYDEDNSLSLNHIYTTFVGAQVKAGTYSEKITHYTVLRTIESAYGLSAIGGAASVSPVTDVWN